MAEQLAPMKFVATRGVAMTFEEHFIKLLSSSVWLCFQKHPVDTFVFELQKDQTYTIRLAGYDFVTDKFDETTVVDTIRYPREKLIDPTEESPERIWFKIDDYREVPEHKCFIGTFLFPEEY